MHPILGLLMLLGLGAFIAFCFRKGQRVRPDGRPDSGSGYYGAPDSGVSHGGGDGGGVGHG
jgi:hypothetical protein